MHHDQWNEIAEEVNFNLEIDIDRFHKNIPFDSKVLDFGCGYGRVSSLLLNSGYKHITGIDSSANMIERGKREFPELHLDLQEGEVLPYPDNSYNAIVACGVFTCITSHDIRDKQMNELCRILKQNGVLHLVEFCSEPSKLFTANIGVPMLHSTPLELKKLAGMFQVVSEEVKSANTMGGNPASCYSLFARKPLNK